MTVWWGQVHTVRGSDGAATISNGKLALSFDPESGKMVNLTDLSADRSFPLSQSFLFYK